MERKITKRAIAAMQPPTTGQAWLHDTELHGFMVLCQKSGRKTYMARYKTPAGSWRKMTLGNVNEMDPDDARDEARKVIMSSRRGIDPAAELERARSAPTMARLADVRIHDLRHTVGSLGHRAGLTQREIADLLGHKQMHTTARYINSADEYKRETADRWGSVVAGLTGK